VTSDAVGRHAVALASVVELAERAGAQRVVLLIDEGEFADATMIERSGDGSLELTEAGVTEGVAPPLLAQVVPVELPDVRPVPPSALSVDEETGELAAPLGALAGLAGAVLALAAAFGGRSVATAEFATREPDQPFMLAARPGEPVVAQIGGETFAFPEGWP
jgi:hypothetical protein